MNHHKKAAGKPPRLADALLELCFNTYEVEEIQGDLYELFERRVSAYGVQKARRLYYTDVFRFLNPLARQRKIAPAYPSPSTPMMLRNYLKITLRTLRHDKVYAWLGVSGLALGIAAFVIIVAFIRYEYSYDKGHEQGERIYRVESLFYKGNDKTDHWATSTNGYGPAMAADFPEIESYTRINWNNSTRVVRYGQTKFREPRVCFVDSNFFTFFSYPVLKGDPATFLNAPNTVVISQRTAQKYFGNDDPIGKHLDISTIAAAYHCQVTGVFKDLPPTSTMQFDIVMSWQTSSKWVHNFWYQHSSYTFVRLRPGTHTGRLEARFPALAERYKTQAALKDHRWAIDLVPLSDIHLNPAKPNEIEEKGSRHAMQFLLALAFIILVTAYINYSNLSAAKAMDRAREAGIRKAVGATRISLMGQLLFEAFLFNAAALGVACVLVILAGNLLTKYLGLPPAFILWNHWSLYLALTAILGIGTCLSGLSPALMLAKVKAVSALKGQYIFPVSGARFRKGLVVVQFAFSLVLITGTLVVYGQLSYMQGQNLGVTIDQVLVLEAPIKTEDYYTKTESFKNELKALSGVAVVTSSGAVPGKEVGKFLANRRLHAGPEEETLYEMLPVDYEFISAYGLQLVAGRNFDRSRPTDQYGLILNESAVKQFGFHSVAAAIGEKVLLEANPGRSNEIIGVIKDYHQESLEQPFKPTILFMDPAFRWIPSNYFSLRIRTGDVPGVLEQVQSIWNQFFPESSLDYFFLDEFFQKQYRQDRQFGRLFLVFSSLAVFIACLGLLGLTSYSTNRRKKEISIRKVLGATVNSILSLLAWDTLKLVLLAAVIAIPVSFYVMGKWLEGYAFRMPLQISHWLLPMGLLVLVALTTISLLSIRAALTNPAKTLRNE